MNRQTIIISAAAVGVIAVVAAGVYLFSGGTDDSPAAMISGPGQASEARDIIADIEQRRANDNAAPAVRPAPALIQSRDAAGEPATGDDTPARAAAPAQNAPSGADPELDAAYERARQLQAAGQLDDAQVLLFFGARRGHARSAFAYGELNDPNHHSAETSLLAEPDAFQAFRWYSAARDGGIDEADTRLDALHEWAETASAGGDGEAERLLLQWE